MSISFQAGKGVFAAVAPVMFQLDTVNLIFPRRLRPPIPAMRSQLDRGGVLPDRAHERKEGLSAAVVECWCTRTPSCLGALTG